MYYIAYSILRETVFIQEVSRDVRQNTKSRKDLVVLSNKSRDDARVSRTVL